MVFDTTILPDELKFCAWCENWVRDGDSSFGQCKTLPKLVDAHASGIIVKITDDGYCDDFDPSEDCIHEFRRMFEEEQNFHEQGGEAAYNGVTPGVDFPFSLNNRSY